MTVLHIICIYTWVNYLAIFIHMTMGEYEKNS